MKSRPTFTKAQVFEMEKVFQKEKYLTQLERAKLSTKVQLTEAQIKNWFQNRRNRWKREQKVTRIKANAIYRAKLTEKEPTLVRPSIDQQEKIVTLEAEINY